MNNLNQIVRPNIKALRPYSSARSEFKGEADIFLDANENPFGKLNRYPDPMQRELKIVLAKEKNININQLFVGNGSDEVIDLLFRIFCAPGKDNVIAMNPSYGMYKVSADINDVELRLVDLDENFEINIESVFSMVDSKTKIIFICSPNNPTGNIVDLSAIKTICNDFQGIVLIDEAYIDFADSPSAIELISSSWNLVISQTFSKARGLAAARVGYAIASPSIIELFNKVKPPYNVSELNQKAALNALAQREQFKKALSQIKEERKIVSNALNQLKNVRKVFPSEANFLLVEFTDGPKVYRQLVDKGIITRNRNAQVNNCIRITIGTQEENNQLLKQLKQYADEKESIIS